MLKASGTSALHHLDHFWGIPLLAKTPRSSFTAVPSGNDDHRLRRIGKRRIPGDTKHIVEEPTVELVLALGFWSQLGRTIIHPLLPTLPHQWPL